MNSFRRRFTDWAGQLAKRWLAASLWRRAGFIACYCAAIFVLVNWRNYVVDNIPQSLVPVVLWREGSFRLDSYRPEYEALTETGQGYAFTEAGGHLYPRNSIYTSLLVAPAYLPPVLLGVPTHSVGFWVAWGGCAAAIWTGVAVALSYLTIRRWGDEPAAVAFSLLLAFGTCLWTIVAHTVYDHLGGLVCVAALSWVLNEFPLSPRRAAAAAFLAGAAVGMRPCTLVLLLPLGLYLFCWPGIFANGWARLAAVAGVILIPLSNAYVNAQFFGAWYKTGYPDDLATDWGNPWWEGLSGLLIAPNSGILIQSPFTILALIGAWVVCGRAPLKQIGLLRAYAACFLSYWVLFAHRNQWQGGLDFSSRYLSEGYPLWMPLVMVGWNRLKHHRLALPSLIAAGTWSWFYQVINIATFDAVTPMNAFHRPWNPLDHFFVHYLRHFGIGSAVAAILFTIGEFAVCATVCFLALVPFFLPRPKGAAAQAGSATVLSADTAAPSR
jgi:hypothetical protein